MQRGGIQEAATVYDQLVPWQPCHERALIVGDRLVAVSDLPFDAAGQDERGQGARRDLQHVSPSLNCCSLITAGQRRAAPGKVVRRRRRRLHATNGDQHEQEHEE
jgi:hypothetical protein